MEKFEILPELANRSPPDVTPKVLEDVNAHPLLNPDPAIFADP